jgi:hypothetical protein
MKIVHRHILIQFLLVALVGLGFAQGGLEDCSTVCSHCVKTVVPPCCADGVLQDYASHSRSQLSTGKSSNKSGKCGQDAFCPGNIDQDEATSRFSLIAKDLHNQPSSAYLVTAKIFSLHATRVQHQQPLPKSPFLYDLNCSYLI